MAIAVTNDASALKRSANVPGQTSYSIWGWFNFTSVTPARFWGPLGIYAGTDGSPTTATDCHQISSAASGSAQLDLVYYTSGGVETHATLATVSANTWYFMALTCSALTAGNLKAYIRAVTANTLTTASNAGTARTFTPARAEWGRDSFSTDFISGSMHALGMADAVLSVDELLELSYFHEPQLDGLRSLNVFYPCISDTAANCQVDKSGNARNATATPGALADSPPLLWQAISPPWNLPAAGGGSDVTLGLTGLLLASSAGTLIPSNALPLTGQSLASAQGTLTPAPAKALSGQVLASAQGTLTPAISIVMVGSSLTSAIGTLLPNLSIALTGLLITIGQGNLSAPGNITAALTGLLIASSQGTLLPAIAKTLTGSALTAALGTVLPGTIRSLTGVPLLGSLGALGPAMSVSVVGSVITASQGNLTPPTSGDPTPPALRSVTVSINTALTVNATGEIVVNGPDSVTIH